jgi:hypothetical protein
VPQVRGNEKRGRSSGLARASVLTGKKIKKISKPPNAHCSREGLAPDVQIDKQAGGMAGTSCVL